MKTVDNIRRIDELGRVVLPMGIRRTLNIENKESLEIFVDSEKILLKKHGSNCILCGNENNLIEFKGKNICSECKSGFRENSAR